MLGSETIIAFIPSRDPTGARSFYEGVLGLRFLSQDPFAMVLEANGITIRVANVSSVPGFKPAPFTILGWQVENIEKAARGLREKGVRFERYPGMQQDELGIWNSPSGAKVAWFKDPEGNVLSITEG